MYEKLRGFCRKNHVYLPISCTGRRAIATRKLKTLWAHLGLLPIDVSKFQIFRKYPNTKSGVDGGRTFHFWNLRMLKHIVTNFEENQNFFESA